MPHSFYLKPHELKQLDLALTHHQPEVRKRAKALMLIHYGHTFDEVCEAVGAKSRTSIYGWIKRWQKDGLEGLIPNPIPGRPPLVSESYCQILEAITVMQPKDFGLEQLGWTVEALNQIMQEKTGILISDKSLREVLHRLGYSFQLVRQSGISSSKNLPKTMAEFRRYMEELREQAPMKRDFRTWRKTAEQ